MNNSNDTNSTDHDWIKSAVNELDDSVESMDAIDASRLRTVRHMAYREAESRRNKGWAARLGNLLNWQSGFALACTIALVATLTLNINLQRADQANETVKTAQFKPKVGIEVIPLLTAKEDLEFYESVNFLLWLENQQGKS
jgi:hypothetical protein